MGAEKPDPVFFQNAFARVPDLELSQTMIVGDSLTSDILGGKNAGILTCWINPQHKPGREDIVADYELESITQLEALLQTL